MVSKKPYNAIFRSCFMGRAMQELFRHLAQIGQKRRYAAGEILFFEGQESECLYVLLRGKVRLYKSKWETQTPSYTPPHTLPHASPRTPPHAQPRERLLGAQHTLHILNAPQCVAEMPFFMRAPYPANAECVEECEIVVLDYPRFRQALADSELCLLFIHSLCQKIQILESHINAQNQNLQNRLLSYLQAHKSQLPTLTQRQIAQSLNISPESLSRTLKALKANGTLSTDKGKIRLL